MKATGPLLERDVELDAIDRAIKAASGETGSVVLVEGYAGLGKSRLLAAAVERAKGLGVQVLSARGIETEQEFSFGVVLQLLQRRVMTAAPEEREELLSGAAALARPLFEGTRLAGVQGPEAAFATYHGLYWVVSNLTDRSPLVLAIDDAHWADAASTRFLESLANRLEGLPVTIVMVRRLGESGSSASIIETIANAPHSSTLGLQPLTDDAVTELVRTEYGPSADDRFCNACARAVRGNPFYLRELLAELRAREVSADATGVDQVEVVDVTSVARSVEARLRRLGDEAVRLAEATSLTDGGMPLRHVARLAELETEVAGGAAGALVDAQILDDVEPPEFVHPLVRNAVYAGLPDHRRRSMHRRAAELLREEGADPERIAGHLHSSDPGSADWAVGTLLQAGLSAIERAAPETAVHHLRRAVAEGGADHWRPAILAPLGLACIASGESPAIEVVREAARLMDRHGRARYLLLASEFLFVMQRFEESQQIGKESLAQVDETEDEETAGYVIAYLAGLSAVTSFADMEPVRRLEAVSDRFVRRGGRPSSSAERLVAGVFAGIIAFTGRRSAREAYELATSALSTAPGEEIRAAMFEAPMSLVYVDAYEEADRAFQSSIEAARRLGAQHVSWSAHGHRAESRYRAGLLREAVADAESALDGGRGGWIELPARAVLALALMDMGDVQGAERAIDLPDIDRWMGATHLPLFHESRGRVLFAQGRVVEASEAFRAAGEFTTSDGTLNPAFCAWRSGAALAESALGHRDAAIQHSSEELRAAEAFGAKRAIGVALRAHGLVTGGSAGLEILVAATEVLGACDARLEHARALIDLGAALRRIGHVSDARERLRLGLDLAASCDARGLVQRARGELVAAGGRPRRERLLGLDALTPQERRIAEHVAEGMSNKEIAQALFLSRKTIETHLTSVYSKLGVRSREEIGPLLRADAG